MIRRNKIGFFVLVVFVLLFFYCMFAPLFAQTRTYTNADLGKKLPASVETSSGDHLAGLRANQFRLVLVYDGPTAIIFSAREGSRLFDDPEYRFQQVGRAWASTFYGGRAYMGKFSPPPFTSSSQRPVSAQAPVRHPR